MNTPKSLDIFMKSIVYDKTPLTEWKLKSLDEINETLIANCHDEVVLAYHYLKLMNSYKNKNESDVTELNKWFIHLNNFAVPYWELGENHSFITFKYKDKYYKFDSTSESISRIHGPYKTLDNLMKHYKSVFESHKQPGNIEIYNYTNVRNLIGCDYETFRSKIIRNGKIYK